MRTVSQAGIPTQPKPENWHFSFLNQDQHSWDVLFVM
jgi:hypothetical protein